MLSKNEKEEMKELAASHAVREEFRLLRKHSENAHTRDVDRYIRFLSTMSRLNPHGPRPRPFVKYDHVKL